MPPAWCADSSADPTATDSGANGVVLSCEGTGTDCVNSDGKWKHSLHHDASGWADVKPCDGECDQVLCVRPVCSTSSCTACPKGYYQTNNGQFYCQEVKAQYALVPAAQADGTVIYKEVKCSSEVQCSGSVVP